MKSKPLALLGVVLCNLAACVDLAFAQGTAFTYQGRLDEGGNPAQGTYDLRFAIYDTANAGFQQGSAITSTGIAVTNGFFTVTLDFGNQFPVPRPCLETRARTTTP